jgi:selenocysteine lyase/cysteine desulfurase
VYVREALVRELEPAFVSWMAVRGSDDFTRLTDYDLTWRDDARRFEFITLPFQDFAGMNESLELLLEIGPDAAALHVATLADEIVRWAVEQPDVELVTPSAPERRSGIISVRPADPAAASARLKAAGVVHSLREGAVRLSPHFYNTMDEVQRALAIMS